MSDPVKILWKYKNNNRRVQYNLYIFIGNTPKSIDNILEKIKNLNMYNSLITLTVEEHKQMNAIYSEKWYEKFFNINHINFSLSQTKKQKQQNNSKKFREKTI